MKIILYVSILLLSISVASACAEIPLIPEIHTKSCVISSFDLTKHVSDLNLTDEDFENFGEQVVELNIQYDPEVKNCLENFTKEERIALHKYTNFLNKYDAYEQTDEEYEIFNKKNKRKYFWCQPAEIKRTGSFTFYKSDCNSPKQIIKNVKDFLTPNFLKGGC